MENESDRTILKLLEHDERFDKIEANMVTKADHAEVMSILKKILVIVKNTQEKLVMHTSWIRRNERRIEVLEGKCGI